uniref:DUF2934 domain-containing protein n=1 Tax=Candidatus Kentrum sp. FW TaxID=2126338 RepID=A0A450SRS6_9GAMM|nr:MAG: Protein of unknown function (DUF2934) [Candidatus Kentron sp. FW]VFJ59724.1 MAG: Protein of unknown function (DUF2934) [Candidatus Kentron sp. FW]
MIEEEKPATGMPISGKRENRKVDPATGATHAMATNDASDATSTQDQSTDNELATEALKRQTLANSDITPEERWNMIAVSAYYRAEQRGFIGGNPAEDWIAAEKEIDILLSGKQ